MTSVVDILLLAALYFLLASGLTFILDAMGSVNYAHGLLFAIGAAVAQTVTAGTGSSILAAVAAVVAAVVAVAALGVVLQASVLRAGGSRGLPHTVATIGAALAGGAVVSAHFVAAPTTSSAAAPVPVAPLSVLLVVVTTAAAGIAVHRLLHRSPNPAATRAGAEEDPVRPAEPHVLRYGLAAALAGLAGALGSLIAPGVPGFEARFLLGAALTVVVAGTSSPVAIAVASVAVAGVEVLAASLVPGQQAAWSIVLVVAVLLMRPHAAEREEPA